VAGAKRLTLGSEPGASDMKMLLGTRMRLETIIRMTGGNFRLLNRLLSQKPILEINAIARGEQSCRRGCTRRTW
jgi:hypothetical protein